MLSKSIISIFSNKINNSSLVSNSLVNDKCSNNITYKNNTVAMKQSYFSRPNFYGW